MNNSKYQSKFKSSIFVFCSVLFFGMGLLFASELSQKSNLVLRVGVLVPMQHAALEEIVDGFQTVLKEHYGDRISINVQNAQGDVKLERSILELFKGQSVDLIVPIGTRATQMTLSLIKEMPIVSLAAMVSESERQKRKPLNITGILDEIGGKEKLDFIRGILPTIKEITLIYHSGNEKNFEEVAELKAYAQQLGITVQPIVIQNLLELTNAAQGISEKSGAVLILKDHLMASGIRLLVPLVAARHIPLIASDEGSVKEGATIALGVREKMIGEEGGHLAIEVLEGKPLASLPMQPLKELAVFYHSKRDNNLSLDEVVLQHFAHQHAYQLIDMNVDMKKEH